MVPRSLPASSTTKAMPLVLRSICFITSSKVCSGETRNGWSFDTLLFLPHNARRHTRHNGVCRHIFYHYRTRSDHGSSPNVDALLYRRGHPHVSTLSNFDAAGEP